MAAVEVYKGSGQIGNNLTIGTDLFQLATFFSASAHFDIIDSFSNSKGRYKGDPIADAVWTASSDLNNANEWIIIECQTSHPMLATMGYTGLPKWQCKIQMASSSVSFADVSDPTGATYPKNHGVLRVCCVRFAPYGGWDLADTTPDFNPSSPPLSGHVSTQNHKQTQYTNVDHWVMICADGHFIRTAWGNSATYKKIWGVCCMVGDIVPIKKDYMPMPRCAHGNGLYSNAVYQAIPPGSGLNFLAENNYKTNGVSDYATTDSGDGGIAFWDHNEELIESGYQSANGYATFWGLNSQLSTTPSVDLIPFIPVPWKTGKVKPYFSFPYCRKGVMPGITVLDSKQWLSVGNGYGPFFIWDGSTGSPF